VLSRRKIIGGLIGAGAIVRAPFSTARNTASAIDFEVPAGACDCHTHIIGDYHRFPLSTARTYTPPLALPLQLSQLHQKLGVQRVVIVTPSAYGTNNAATLWGVRDTGSNARAVVVVDAGIADQSLLVLHSLGARGVRLYLADADVTEASARQQFSALVARLTKQSWHIQVFTTPRIVSALKDLVLNSPLPVVFDHFGGMRGELGVTQAGFTDLLQMMKSGKAYVKISAAYRFSSAPPDFSDMQALVDSLLRANVDRLLWGTDWPHTSGAVPGRSAFSISPAIEVDDVRLLNVFGKWVTDAKVRRRILVENPVKLYGF
jgi:predicted TIM-barrel fold metal-dependent hydrolase